MDKVKGSMGTLSAMQLTADMEGLDAQSKTLLHSREVLAVILQGVVSEYQGYSRQEIMDFIEADSIVGGKEVSSGRTNSQIQGDAAEFVQLNEKTSQLSLVTEMTDYGQLEKCYSIWICQDDIPKEARYSISLYEVVNTKNVGSSTVEKETYDLMTLAVIKLGDRQYNGEKGDEGFDLLHFLNAVMYPHREDFMETISDYIDFSDNEELWKEEPRMFSLSQCIYEEGREEGIAALVLDHIEEHIPKERSIQKL